jgi:hypothetical protein
MSALSEKDLSLLHTHLVVPIAVGDVVYGKDGLSPDMEYSLHEALSEIDPDSALLAIALSGKHIALQYSKNNPIAGALSIECSKIIDDYGRDWLLNFNRGPLDEDSLIQTLSHVPEDLESMADLLDSFRSTFSDDTQPVAVLCKILSIQARAHMEIADFILTELENVDKISGIMEHLDVASTEVKNNIILFPVHLRH